MSQSNARVLLLVVALLILIILPAGAQTITTGDVSGTVTDISGAVVTGASVTVEDVSTGARRVVITNESGAFRVSLLKPGQYNISASGNGLSSPTVHTSIAVGKVQVVNLTAKPQGTSESVDVTAEAPLLQTEDANLTTSFSERQLAALPTPGGDITTVAFSAPGVVVSTGAGFGAFSSHGLPATANLFTVNGNDAMDPYLNLNTSGASNLTLGGSEIQEAVVVQNGYSGQYGRQAGAQVNYISRSGGNAFHGSLQYGWNGAALNANDWFNNNTNTPKGKANSNQWSGSISGPIKKDKLFFFYSTEGLRYILPSSGTVALPSAKLQQFILSQVAPDQQAFYQQAFNLYNSAPGVERAVAVTGAPGASGPLQDGTGNLGCGSLAGLAAPGGGTFGVDTSCANAFNTNVSNLNKEWLQFGRVDWNISDAQKVFFRYREGHGVQPTITDPINPVFNVESNQPSWEGQVNHTYVLSPNSINNFIFSSNYYRAIFAPKDLPASISALPSFLRFFDGGANGANFGAAGFTNLGLNFASFPQGRVVSQYSFVDDFATTQGKHAIKFGVNFRRDNVTDNGPLALQSGGRFTFFDLNDFANGSISPATGSNFVQRTASFQKAHIALSSLGLYIQDEWAVKSNLKLTFALRGDVNQNPVCRDDCFARLNNTFPELAKGDSIPFNQSITTGLETAFPHVEAVALQPRIGFTYSPFGNRNTVLRGGIGIFSDLFPGVLASNVFLNSPNVFTPTVRTGLVNGSGAGSAPEIAAVSGQAFQHGFANGETRAQIAADLAALGVGFTEPGFFAVPDKLLNPKYLEWNFEVQQQIGQRNVISVNYVGNHGYNLFVQNAKANAFSTQANFATSGIPNAAPDPRFRIVTQLSNTGTSNYDGLTATYTRGFGYGFQGHISYTWSHALDDVSNGGLNSFFSVDSLTSQLDPTDLRRLNYSDSDYDIRHNLGGDFVWELPYKFHNTVAKAALADWTLGAKYYWRSGTPFSVFNTALPGRISNSIGGTVLAQLLNPNVDRTCEGPNETCFTAADFATTGTQTGFGNLRRNSFRGPHYADADLSVSKRIFKLERVGFSIGANMFNVFNHPNFASPGQDVSNAGLGAITSTVTPPSSPFGSFQGSAVSGRVVQLNAHLTF